ncbi:MAG: LPS export ABC transporter periplasmic protein LptC [Campylobacterota bacterium]|nr:LPS export ABC transporter periplasmic protein LptC [Campylobacterota bacterium]
MNINLFFIIVIALLLSVFIFFKPLEVNLPDHKEIAQLELKNFEIYEVNQEGVKSILEGERGERYENRYEVIDATFKDASKEKIEVMHADYGRYQNDKIYLKENVIYAQDNGITFQSDEAMYDINASLITTQRTFIMTSKENYFKGQKLKFNTKENIMFANTVSGSYNLEQK